MTATPDIDAFTRPYWDAAAEGRLLLRRCRACARPLAGSQSTSSLQQCGQNSRG